MEEMKGGVRRKRKRRSIDADDDLPKRWSDLPNELLESIKKRLFYIDQCKLSAVCKSWNCIQEEEDQERILLDVPPLQQMPWLLVFDEPYSCKLVDSKYKKTYTIDTKTIKEEMNISSLKNTTIHESKYGWLLISSTQTCIPTKSSLFLFSPFLNKKNNFIKLPILNVSGISLAAFTSNPLDDDDKDFTVVALTSHYKSIIVNTYRRGDASWNCSIFNCEFSLENVKCWMHSQGIFYYLTELGHVGKFDLAREEWNVFPSPPLTPREIPIYFSGPYMVKSNDKELFLFVEKNYFRGKCIYSRHHICRLDLLSNIWEDSTTSIGEDRVLFVGNAYNCVLSSSVLKSNGVLHKGISDTIYYCSLAQEELMYCTFGEYPAGQEYYDGYYEQEFFRRQPCSRQYGRIARNKCLKVLIDPPSSSAAAALNRARW